MTPCSDVEGLRRTRDLGYTLTEALVTIALMAIVVVPVLTAVQTLIKSSSTNHSAAEVESAVVNAIDRINRAPQSCDYANYGVAAAQSIGWAGNEIMTTTETLKGSCTGADDATFDLVQRITISVTAPDAEIVRVVEVVKSRV